MKCEWCCFYKGFGRYKHSDKSSTTICWDVATVWLSSLIWTSQKWRQGAVMVSCYNFCIRKNIEHWSTANESAKGTYIFVEKGLLISSFGVYHCAWGKFLKLNIKGLLRYRCFWDFNDFPFKSNIFVKFHSYVQQQPTPHYTGSSAGPPKKKNSQKV